MIDINVRRLKSGELDIGFSVHYEGTLKELETIQYTIIKGLKRLDRDAFHLAMMKFIEEDLRDEQGKDIRK